MSAKVDDLRVGKEFDRRRKLTDEEREELKQAKGTMSQRAAAEKFGVSRRLVQFIWFPDKVLKHKKALEARGGWKAYYDKDRATLHQRNHRAYKRELFYED